MLSFNRSIDHALSELTVGSKVTTIPSSTNVKHDNKAKLIGKRVEISTSRSNTKSNSMYTACSGHISKPYYSNVNLNACYSQCSKFITNNKQSLYTFYSV